MKKIYFVFLLISMMSAITSCQELNITIQYAEEETTGEENRTEHEMNPTITAKPAPTRTPNIPDQTSIQGNGKATFKPENHFFQESLLPEYASFYRSDTMTFNTTYLNTPGNLSGIAHVRLYEASIHSIIIEEIIVESSVPTSQTNLKVGYRGEDFLLDNSEQALGEYAMLLTSTELGAITYHYHFSKGNFIVLVSLGGMDDFVSKESVYSLAKDIEERLPYESPVISNISVPSFDLQSDLFEEYFDNLEIMSCSNPDFPLDAIPVRANGLCLSASIIKLIGNFKVGVYADEYEEVIFIREFDQPQQGQQFMIFFHSIWGLNWHELSAGDYQALFWVNDQLVKIIPFTLINTY